MTPGWRTALRLARRDALRSRANSLLVLLLIALPVLAVTAAAVVWETRDIDSNEALDRRLGTSEAFIETVRGARSMTQAFDPEEAAHWETRADDRLATLDDVRTVVGDVPVTTLTRGGVEAETDKGRTSLEVAELDLTDPLTDGLYTLLDGRLPTARGEVAVTPTFDERGPGIGETLTYRASAGGEARTVEVVGVAESTTYRDLVAAVAPTGTFGLTEESTYVSGWLVGGDAVTWDDVVELNALALKVTSRAVLTDPPPVSVLDPDIAWSQQPMDDTTVMVIVLIVVMVLIEVVLLAGPAFAVGARRHARTLALIAASGGTPTQARRVVLASAVVLGALGALLGSLLGVGLGAAVLPLVQRFDQQWFGPFDVPWLVVAGVTGFGVLSALLAATVPAWLAARQDPVAVLGGRRGDPRPSLRSPLVGLVLVGLGIAGAAFGVRQGGELFIAASAILSVLGMIFLVPLVVVGVSRLATRLPLPLRFAARDAARHRTRTVPAVAAVAATVAGVVALGIAVSSDEAQARETYLPTLSAGHGLVSSYDQKPDWGAYAQLVRGSAPEVEISEVQGVLDREGYLEASTVVDGAALPLDGWGSIGSSVTVGSEVPSLMPLSAADRAQADAALAQGGVVAFTNTPGPTTTGTVKISVHDREGAVAATDRARLPVAPIGFEGWSAPGVMVLSPEAAEALHQTVTTVALDVSGPISEAAEQDLAELISGLSTDTGLLVERGYQPEAQTVIIQLVLGALGAVLMIGGTLTATFLALSDARSDLATLSAVGAAPRTRRGIAAAYALVVGLVGAVLGALVGAVPGVAISYPLTQGVGPEAAEHYLDVPWLLIAIVVVGLPLLTSLLVGLTARSRLPLVARLD